jgi:hypothetical protein
MGDANELIPLKPVTNPAAVIKALISDALSSQIISSV